MLKFPFRAINLIGWLSEDRNSIFQFLILSVIADNIEKSFTGSSIYPAIKQLVHKGYLEKSSGRPMRVWLSKAGEKRIPTISRDLVRNIRTFMRFVFLYQENLAEFFPELREEFLSEIVSLMSKSKEEFSSALKDTKKGRSEWKEVNIK
jgi:sugar-specific transcriptional regulator TrmB